MIICCCCFFFFKQKTAYEMLISDWSSDVCSSDLVGTWPSFRTLAGKYLLSHPDPPTRKVRSDKCCAGSAKNSSTRASRSGRRLTRKAKSHTTRGAGDTGCRVSGPRPLTMGQHACDPAASSDHTTHSPPQIAKTTTKT